MTDYRNDDERQSQVRELSQHEMTDIGGGAWYAKFDGVDGSVATRAILDGYTNTLMIGEYSL